MPKKIHMAALFSQNGDVSPKCAKKPKPIDLGVETWTNRPEAVTCKKCRAALAQADAKEGKP